jgi:hypothetical protein
MQSLVDGAAIIQARLEDVAIYASKPGVIPAVVLDPFAVNNPFEPKTATKDHDATDDSWIARDPSLIYIVTNQTILARPTTAGYGGPIGGFALDPSPVPYIPGQN